MILISVYWVYNCIISLRMYACYKVHGMNDNIEKYNFESAQCDNRLQTMPQKPRTPVSPPFSNNICL